MQADRTSDEQRRVRCLAIVAHMYWSGSCTLHDLAAALSFSPGIRDATIETIEQDIALLRKQGLPIVADRSTGHLYIDGHVPGFSWRLTAAEMRILWSWFIAHRNFHARPDVDAFPLFESINVLLAGLLRLAGSRDVLTDQWASPALTELALGKVLKRRIESRILTGEARTLHRRLRIIDLVEGKRAHNSAELAVLLEMSSRTIQDDLNVLRDSGIEIHFNRQRRCFVLDGLNAHLATHLTLPMAAALTAQLRHLAVRKRVDASPVFKAAAQKLIKGLQVIFKGQAEALEDGDAVAMRCQLLG